MKFVKYLLVVVFVFALNFLNAQYKIFFNSGKTKKGNIVTKKVGVFENEIFLEGNKKPIKIEDINKIEKNKIVFKKFVAQNQNLFFNNKHALLQNVIDGKTKVWSYKFAYEYKQKNETKTAVRNIFYIENQFGNLTRLDQRDYLKTLKSVLTGNKEILQILNNRGYAYNQIPAIVKMYNKL